MKRIVKLLALFSSFIISQSCLAQGWVAEIDLNFTHFYYAYENISNATFTFSGVTMTSSSETGMLSLTMYGSGPISGDINLSIRGTAWEPYDKIHPFTEPISAQYTGNYTVPCVPGFFEQDGETLLEEVFIWIRVYPRLEISQFLQECERLTLTSNTCSPSYRWEISDHLSEGFRTIPGKSAATLVITRDELVALGFSNPFGRKYFRVTGLSNTTSQLQPVDIYYPGPTAFVTTTVPKCHGSTDGSVRIDITTTSPSINDFVVTLFRNVGSVESPVAQKSIFDETTTGFSGLIAGDYRLKVENNTGINTYGNCWAEYAFPLKDPDAVTIGKADLSDFNGFQIPCEGGNEGTIRIFPAGGTGSYSSYEWTPSVSTTNFANNLAAGTYQVRVKDSNSCWSTPYTYKTTAPEKISVELMSIGGKNGFDVSCADKTDGEIHTEVSGGVSQYTYNWSDGIKTDGRTNIGPGFYHVTVADANGCTETKSLTLVAPDPIDFSIAEINGIICSGDYSGVLEIQSAVNVIGNVRYAWSSGETQKQITDKPAGTYSATVSDEQGCSTVKLHTLEEPLPYSVNVIAASDYNGIPIRCKGENNGSLAAIVTDAGTNVVPADNYTWYHNGRELFSGANLAVLSGLYAGVYKAEITYRGFCKAEETFTLTEPRDIEVAISSLKNYNGMPVSCAGASDGSIHAQAAGGTGTAYNFHWESGESGPDLTDIGAGTYVVTATDINGCEGKVVKTLIGPEPLKGSVTVSSNYHGQAISCAGRRDARLKASVQGGTPPFRYSWNTGATGQELFDVPAGNYVLTTEDVNGCTSVENTTIADPLPVKATIAKFSDYNGYGISCHGLGDGYLLSQGSGGTGVFTFSWKESTNRQALHSNLKAGRYSVQIVDQNGCSDAAEGVLDEPGILIAEISNIKNVSCNKSNDGEIQLKGIGGAGPYAYSVSGNTWQVGSLKGLTAGHYEPRVKDANGCMQTIAQTILEPTAISIQFENIEPALCGDPKGEVSARVTGGTGPYVYEWKNSQHEVMGHDTDLTGLSGGIFTLQILDDNQCSASQAIGITTTNGPTVQVDDITGATCSYSTDGAASLKVLGNGPFSFNWQGGQVHAKATNLAKGNYLVEIKDAMNCMVVENVFIPGPDSLEIQQVESIQPTCHGDCNGRLIVLAKGGNGNYNYEWGTSFGSTVEDLCAGEYQVSVKDSKQCVATRNFKLEAPEPLVIETVSERQPICSGGCDGQLSVKVSGGTGTLQYHWSNGQTGSGINNICAGEYTTTIYDSNHCTIASTYSLDDPEGSTLDLGGSIMLCRGQTHMLDPGPIWERYAWGGNMGFRSSERRIIISETGVYWLEATDRTGCIKRDTFFLETSNDLLSANFLLTSEATVTDTVVAIDISWPLPENINWIFPEEMKRLNDYGDVVYGQFSRPGIYNVSLTARLGECHDHLTKPITILENNQIPEGARLGYESFVKEFSLYPNPNDGVFDVGVEFAEHSPIVMTIWNVLTSRKISQVEDSGNYYYTKHIDLRPLSAGAYSLRLDYGKGTKYIRFIVR